MRTRRVGLLRTLHARHVDGGLDGRLLRHLQHDLLLRCRVPIFAVVDRLDCGRVMGWWLFVVFVHLKGMRENGFVR